MEPTPDLPVEGDLLERLLRYAEDCARDFGVEAGQITLFLGTVGEAEALSGSTDARDDEPAWVLAVEPAEGSFVHPRLGPSRPKQGLLLGVRVGDEGLFLRGVADTAHDVSHLGTGQVLKRPA